MDPVFLFLTISEIQPDSRFFSQSSALNSVFIDKKNILKIWTFKFWVRVISVDKLN